MLYYVYSHINPITKTPFYIGKGKGNRAFSTKGRNVFWNNTVNKYGFEVVLLCDGLTEQQSFEIEKQYIKKYGFRNEGGLLVNLTDGGTGGNTENELNKEERRKKLSLSKIGDKNPNYGKPVNKGIKRSAESIKKQADKIKGRKLKGEHYEKVILGLKKAKEVQSKNANKIICLNTGKIWQNRHECCNELGITTNTLKARIKRNTLIKGYYLKYYKK